MTDFWVSGSCFCGHDGVEDTKGGGHLSPNKWVLNAVGFKLTGEAPVQYGVGLGVWGISWAGEATQETSSYNYPQFLRN